MDTRPTQSPHDREPDTEILNTLKLSTDEADIIWQCMYSVRASHLAGNRSESPAGYTDKLTAIMRKLSVAAASSVPRHDAGTHNGE
jgi:hypothetical protein